MKFVSLKERVPKEELLEALVNDEVTNKGVKFENLSGSPKMRVKEKNGKIRIKCELIRREGERRDNGFIFGTAFYGKIKEKNGVTSLSGLITTELIYHLIFTALMVLFVLQCIFMKGLSVVPICLLIIDIFMFREEFKKQGIIKRYILRAVRRARENSNC